MSNLYYMQRQNKNKVKPKISGFFYNSFLAYLKRIIKEDFFTEEFGIEIEYDNLMGFDENKFLNRMIEEFGYKIPIFNDDGYIPSTEECLSLIEFIYKHISLPIDKTYSQMYDSYIPLAFNRSQARYNYTVKINDMLKKYNHPYKIQGGIVKRINSKILDDRIDSYKIQSNDEHLKYLINTSLELYRKPTGKNKLEALNIIANSFERVKTLNCNDKKKSTEEIIQKITSDTELQHLLNNLFKSITNISNKCTIRHQEKDKIILDDDAIIEFLYYSYYNIIRMILDKYNLVEKSNI